MIAMNAEANVGHRSAPDIAADFLAGKVKAGERPTRAGSSSFWALLFAPDFWPETVQHLRLVFLSLALGILVGVPLGIWAAHAPRAAQPILSIVGVIQTIPSLALLVFLIPVVHQIGFVPAIIALFLYSLLPIVRNTYTGLTDISPALRESAAALGLPAGARLRLIELPLAARAILAGIKTSAVINVGTATIAAFIGAGGYGNRISAGLGTFDNGELWRGPSPPPCWPCWCSGALICWTVCSSRQDCAPAGALKVARPEEPPAPTVGSRSKGGVRRGEFVRGEASLAPTTRRLSLLTRRALLFGSPLLGFFGVGGRPLPSLFSALNRQTRVIMS